jgi:hypothetical protein
MTCPTCRRTGWHPRPTRPKRGRGQPRKITPCTRCGLLLPSARMARQHERDECQAIRRRRIKTLGAIADQTKLIGLKR